MSGVNTDEYPYCFDYGHGERYSLLNLTNALKSKLFPKAKCICKVFLNVSKTEQTLVLWSIAFMPETMIIKNELAWDIPVSRWNQVYLLVLKQEFCLEKKII